MKKLISLVLVTVLAFTGCGNRSAAPAKILMKADAYTFADGESLSIWRYPNDNKQIFMLGNGTELLAVNIVGPENHMEEDTMLFDDLEKDVQDRICAFYNQQGTVFDIDQYLEQAYTEYTEMEDKSLFRCYYLTQGSYISGMDDKRVYCTTSGLLPVNGEDYQSYSMEQAFDRTTGIPVSK